MIPHANPIPHQLPATPPCSPLPSTTEHSGLSSRAESPSLLQSAQAPIIGDLEQLHPELVKARLSLLAEESKDGESVAHEPRDTEILGFGENTSVNSLPLFHGDGWEVIWVDLSDLSRDTSSDEGFSDTSPEENSSQISSDGTFSKASADFTSEQSLE